MGWHIKSPAVFPAKFHSIIRIATDDLDVEHLFAAGSYEECFIEAEKLRYFKYCVRKTGYGDLARLIAAFDIRSKIDRDEMGYRLIVYARPTKLSEFIRLNPELADEILSECQ